MKKENLVRFHRIYGILLSISIVVAGICLIAGCLTIYFTGERIYSREIVADTFSGIALPVYICLALTVIGFFLELFMQPKVSAPKPVKNYTHILNRLLSTQDMNGCDEALLKSIHKEQKNRKLHTTIRTILLCVSSIVFLAYALNGEHFHQSEITASMIHAMWLLIPCLAVPFAYAVFTVYYNTKSLQREIELTKQLPASEIKSTPAKEATGTSEKSVNTLRFALLFVGVAILVYGFISGGTIDVLTKAINICTECIGLG